jgi:hypothetical protein
MFQHLLAVVCIFASTTVNPIHKTESFVRFSLDLGHAFSIQFEDIKSAESGMIYQRARLFSHDDLIFRDDLNEFQVSGEYPKLVPVKDGYELILQNKVSPFLSNLLALSIRGNRVISVQRLPMPMLRPQDVDNDGQLEAFGLIEEYIEIDEENITYSPVIAWQIGPKEVGIDSVASAKLTMMVFGQYNGLEPKPRLVCPCRKRVESKLAHLRGLEK